MEHILKACASIKEATNDFKPEVGIILGTGLGGFVDSIDVEYRLEYKDIPNMPVSTVEGHKGCLIFGKVAGRNVVAMQGRFHYYEGYTMRQVTFPVRVMALLGIKYLFVSNAAGGMNPDFLIGDLMIITDHINTFPEHPLRGKNIEYGDRFPDMSKAYDPELIAKAKEIAAEKAGIESYTLISYPEEESTLTMLLDQTKESYIEARMGKMVGQFKNELNIIYNLENMNNLQARMPYEIHLMN